MKDKPEQNSHEKVLESNLRCNYFQKVGFRGGGEYFCMLIKSWVPS